MIDNTGSGSVLSLWDFSCALYESPGVAAACLEFQDVAEVDVNFILLALFAARSRRRLSSDDFAILDKACMRWRIEVVAALRTVRQLLKTYALPGQDTQALHLRERIKTLEIDSERLEQDALNKMIVTVGEIDDSRFSILDLARLNLKTYVSICSKGQSCEALLESLLHMFACYEGYRYSSSAVSPCRMPAQRTLCACEIPN